MLKIDSLRIRYGNVEAVKGISLEVQHREIVALLGANGAGKSSTLRGVMNLSPKFGGKVFLRGEDISRLDTSEIVRKGCCLVPEGRKIFPYFTVEENLMMGDYGNSKGKTRQTKANLERVFSLFPILAERKRQLGGTLSGGEQQMLAIGRSLMLEPDIIMMDEPSLGLAPILVEQIFALIQEIRDKLNRTILLVEQNAHMALQIADRGYILETGRIALSGPATELRKNPDVARAYLGMA